MPFQFFRPSGLAAVLDLLAVERDAAYVIAGGTDLLLQVRNGRRPPRHLIDLENAGLSGIAVTAQRVTIGATTPLAVVAAHPDILRQLPDLARACGQLGSPQVRNRATLGGNLANASPCADTVPSLLIRDTWLVLEQRGSRRRIPLREFFMGPGATVRQPAELLTAIDIERPAPLPADTQVFDYFRKFGPRRGFVIAATNVSVQVQIRAGHIVQAAIALGSVAPTPIRARQAEDWLLDRPLAPATWQAVALEQAIRADIRPINDVRGSAEYKAQLAVNACREALWSAAQSSADHKSRKEDVR